MHAFMLRGHHVGTRTLRGFALGVLLFAAHADVALAKPKTLKRAEPAPAQVAAEPPSSEPSVIVREEPSTEAPSGPAAPITDGSTPKADGAAPPPSAASASTDKSTAKASAEADKERVTALRSEVTTLMDDLAVTRAKAAVLGKALFKTRMVLRVQNLVGDDPVLASLVLKLDGAPVFRGDGTALHDDEARQVFEGFVAPGPHVLSVELEQRARSDSAYGYTLRESYRITAPREKSSEITLILDDDSDLAEDFADDGEGEYDVRTRLRQKTFEHKER